jgi:hypothetical protein
VGSLRGVTLNVINNYQVVSLCIPNPQVSVGCCAAAWEATERDLGKPLVISGNARGINSTCPCL